MNNRNTEEMYFSVDIESDGPVPGLHSMLSFGVAAFDLKSDHPRKPVALYEANLETLGKAQWPACHQNPATMKWWEGQPEAWEACRKDLRHPNVVFPEFLQWVKDISGKKKSVMVVYPVWDYMWMHWYIHVFGGLKPNQRSPFGLAACDIKSKAAERLGLPFRQTSKRRMPQRWHHGAPKHTHVALDDAIGQGILYVNMERENNGTIDKSKAKTERKGD